MWPQRLMLLLTCWHQIVYPCGSGKTSATKIFVDALNCLSHEGKNVKKPCGECQECTLFFAGRSRDVKEVDSIGIVSDDELLELLALALSPDTSNTVKRAMELMRSRIDPMQLISQLDILIMDILFGKFHENFSDVKRQFFERHTCTYKVGSTQLCGNCHCILCIYPTPANWWTSNVYKQLSSHQVNLKWVRDNHVVYNYGTDYWHFNGKMAPECYKPQY
ncbi:unnamed protein product [Lactuca saligna]|uniref:Xyloglucan endo-transglycosylase C-terminal domain-containing protein n=1 Tax=Lactuca saligna TaxID=75948 RepID=A0AA35V9T8_LACSI|nr:unnamed protein product [Lactuca saligna]